MTQDAITQATPLAYAGTAARQNVICDVREDGVTITLPGTLSSYIRGSEHMLIALARVVIWIIRRVMKYPEPPRMIIELNRTELRITERRGHKENVLAWPRETVGELRPNRYSRGLLVRIPGQANFDILKDCRGDLLHWIGETLTAAMRKTAPDTDTDTASALVPPS
jgi:hypothetical protein